MEETLKRIKELVLVEDRVAFSKKARDEMAADHLTRDEVVSSIYNAKSVRSKRSKSPRRRSKKERVYIIEAPSFSGVLIYTKGTIRKDGAGKDIFYFMISSKRSRYEGGAK